jgi:hypothetical protein
MERSGTKARTNSDMRSQRVMTDSYPALCLVAASAANRASCLSTSCGLAFASASRRAIPAIVDGLGVGCTVGRLNMEPRERKRGTSSEDERRYTAGRVSRESRDAVCPGRARAVNDRQGAKTPSGCRCGGRSEGPILKGLSIYDNAHISTLIGSTLRCLHSR